MAIEEYGVLAASVGLAVIVGFVLGKLSANASSNRSTTQRITQNELTRWKINSKYVDILNHKNPEKFAEQELSKLDKKKQSNMEEMKEIESKLSEYLDTLEKIRVEANSLNAPIQVSMKSEVDMSMWAGLYTELRQNVEDVNNTNIRHGYSKRFLKFIIHGNVKPGLVELMDNSSVDDEILTAGLKKNFKLTDALIEAMTSENDEKRRAAFGINK